MGGFSPLLAHHSPSSEWGLGPPGTSGAEDPFLVRVGKDGSRQVTGRLPDAARALRDLRDELEDGSYVPTRKMRFETFLEHHFLPWKRPGLKPKTIREYFVLARAALSRAVSLRLIPHNPAEQINPREQRSEDWWRQDPLGQEDGVEGDAPVDLSRVWTEEEVRHYVEVADPALEMTRWVRAGMELGLRPQEQCGLRWRDVDFAKGLVRIQGAVVEVDQDRRKELGKWVWGPAKTGSRTISMSEAAREVLRMQWDGLRKEGLKGDRAEFVFPARRGPRPFNNPSNIKDRLRDYFRRQGDFRGIPPYGMRHTHATRLLNHGWDSALVAQRLGTSVEMISRHYGHLLLDYETKALARMPLPGGGPAMVVGNDHDATAGDGSTAKVA